MEEEEEDFMMLHSRTAKTGVQLPREIRKAIRKKKAGRLLLYLLATMFVAVILAIWGNRIFSFPAKLIALKYQCYIASLLLPILFTRVYRIFTDKNYSGEVKETRIKSVVDSKSSVKPTREQLYQKNIIYLTIKDAKGKTFKKKVYEAPVKLNAHLDEMYRVGDHVLHLYGTSFTVVLPTAADTHCSCGMCGWSNDKHRDVCAHCGLPLIQSIPSFHSTKK